MPKIEYPVTIDQLKYVDEAVGDYGIYVKLKGADGTTVFGNEVLLEQLEQAAFLSIADGKKGKDKKGNSTRSWSIADGPRVVVTSRTDMEITEDGEKVDTAPKTAPKAEVKGHTNGLVTLDDMLNTVGVVVERVRQAYGDDQAEPIGATVNTILIAVGQNNAWIKEEN